MIITTITMNTKAEIKDQARSIKPMLRIGKMGITDGMINEIKIQLKKRKILKIRLLRSVLMSKEKDEIVKEILDKTNSELISKRGNNVVVYKR